MVCKRHSPRSRSTEIRCEAFREDYEGVRPSLLMPPPFRPHVTQESAGGGGDSIRPRAMRHAEASPEADGNHPAEGLSTFHRFLKIGAFSESATRTSDQDFHLGDRSRFR